MIHKLSNEPHSLSNELWVVTNFQCAKSAGAHRAEWIMRVFLIKRISLGLKLTCIDCIDVHETAENETSALLAGSTDGNENESRSFSFHLNKESSTIHLNLSRTQKNALLCTQRRRERERAYANRSLHSIPSQLVLVTRSTVSEHFLACVRARCQATRRAANSNRREDENTKRHWEWIGMLSGNSFW